MEGALDGNICRCTGYRPILQAFKTFCKDNTSGDIEDLCGKKCEVENKEECCQLAKESVGQGPNWRVPALTAEQGKVDWFYPKSIADLFRIIRSLPKITRCGKKKLVCGTDKLSVLFVSRFMLVAGHTGAAVLSAGRKSYDVFISLVRISPIHQIFEYEINECHFGRPPSSS